MNGKQLHDLMSSASGLSLGRVESVGNTGDSTTLKITGIIKISQNRDEIDLLEWFEEQLKNDYSTVFPRFRQISSENDSNIFELEYVGDSTLESLLLTSENTAGISPLEIVQSVGDIVCKLATFQGSLSSTQCLIEILQAIELNTVKAGLHIRQITAHKIASYVPCLTHRDLSVSNVMVDKESRVHLIDPRREIPGAPLYSIGFGSVAVDLASFLVSLERKEYERNRAGLESLPLVEMFRKTVDSLLEQGLFNESMLDLCIVHAYSIYAACKCDYCTASERSWLYEIMCVRFQEALERIV